MRTPILSLIAEASANPAPCSTLLVSAQVSGALGTTLTAASCQPLSVTACTTSSGAARTSAMHRRPLFACTSSCRGLTFLSTVAQESL